jgi:VWFA-related protein
MQAIVREKRHLKIAVFFILLLLLDAQTAAQNSSSRSSDSSKSAGQAGGDEVRIPSRSSAPLFKGKQERQKTEIQFDPATRTVTIKLLVQDPNGYFIPNLRRENFVVYENGVRQQNVAVDIEHAPVSVALLMEFGGRSPGINRDLGQEVSRAARQFLEVLGRDDKVAVWKYSDKVEKLADFSQGTGDVTNFLLGLGTPEFSETNLYDAIIFTLGQMRPVKGRKAIILISSGIDTASKASFDDVLTTARNGDTPIYVISVTRVLHQIVQMQAPTEPLARIDWQKAEKELEEIANASGGRAYTPESTIDLSATYDDLIENLKVRYVLTYRSSNNLDLNTPRNVRIELVDPRTGGPLHIVDTSGKTIPSKIVVQSSYTPNAASSLK